MVQRAIRLDGTCTGEHGIGLHKMGYLVDEAGAGAVEMMRPIKRALDPKNIMNPGKVFSMLTIAPRGAGAASDGRRRLDGPALRRIAAASTLSSCTPKPHSRATCLSTSCASVVQRPVVVLEVAQRQRRGRRAG